MEIRKKLIAIVSLLAFVTLVPHFAQTEEKKADPKSEANGAKKIEKKKDNPWVLKKDKNGIKVFIRNVEGSGFKEFLGMAVFDTSIDRLERIISDVPNQVNWMCDVIEARVIREDRVNPIQYNVISAPLVSNRDVVIQTRVVRTPGKVIRYFTGIQLDAVPPRKGAVRMPKMVGMWMFESMGPNRTRVTYQNLTDPGGSLPSGLVNMTVVKMPFVTLEGMRKQLDNPKYK